MNRIDEKFVRSMVVFALVAGGVFGALTSLINDVSSPYGLGGSPTVTPALRGVAELLSKFFGVGWGWAALAVAAGWLAHAGQRAVVSAVLSLLAATTAYYCMDSVLREQALAGYRPEMLGWGLASLVLGPVLGIVGASIRRPGVLGLLAGLTLPALASAEMVVRPNGLLGDPAMDWARFLVWTSSVVAAVILTIRFRRSLACSDSHRVFSR